MENVAWEQGLGFQQLFAYKSDCHKLCSLMMGTSNLAILIFIRLFLFLAFVIAHNFMKDGSHDGLAARGV